MIVVALFITLYILDQIVQCADFRQHCNLWSVLITKWLARFFGWDSECGL